MLQSSRAYRLHRSLSTRPNRYTTATAELPTAHLQMGRQVLLKEIYIDPHHILTVRFHRKCRMGGFINLRRKNLFPWRVFWEEITPLRSRPRDTLFPSRYIILHYRSLGCNYEAQNPSLGPRVRGKH